MWRDVFFLAAIGFTVSAAGRTQQTEGAFVEKLGEELWQLSQLVTKLSEITAKYKSLNARVDTNDGRNLTGQIVDNVGRLFRRREQAIRCVQERAEELLSEWDRQDTMVKNFTLEYANMQYGANETPIWKMSKHSAYSQMDLKEDPNFFHIPVNTSFSAVHVPVNLYDRFPFVAEAIKWSAGLDEIFLRNYKADPGIKWQYFGGSTGILRHFPAISWLKESEAGQQPNLYDCRTRPWFIEAATCAKDVVILVDSSGSMTGIRNTIAKLVVKKLLYTLGNNDFVNVYNFAWTATPVVKCLETLVQANEDNIQDMMDAMRLIKPQGNASVPNAFKTAFKLLEEAREERGCGNITDCQQAIMLITDGLPGNITDVFEAYNRLPDGSVPVRVFTYLLGLEVRGVNEIQDIACQNRGYYSHMTNLDQVQDSVLKYLAVLARPLALEAQDHPVRWTHLFADVDDVKVSGWLRRQMKDVEYFKSEYFSQLRRDLKYLKVVGDDRKVKELQYKLMTSGAIPVFDTRELIINQTKFPEFLAGIVGTDVPVEDIFKLTFQYKIGANGYAFIVTNNGHILMHPEHRPVYNGTLKRNYNSVDMLDVEFVRKDSDKASLETVRSLMVAQELGDVQNVMVKFHYDNFNRVGVEKRDYYVAPIDGTPFSLGLAIPSDYGDYQIAVKDIVNERFLMTTNSPLEAFFRDPEWRIHPDWFYCKYKYPADHKFDRSEYEVLDILRKIKNQAEWKKYQELWLREQHNDTDEDPCYPPETQGSFHCDPELIILLIFDASVTNDSFRDPVTVKNHYEEKLMKTYNATLRFVGTQSGLTRWQKIPKPQAEETDRGDFGDYFPRTIEEPWFKAAVLQFNQDTRGESNKTASSFVFTVPLNAGELAEDILITGSIALFPRDGGRKAPASVVGYRFTYDSFKARIEQLSNDYKLNCSSDDLGCFIVDNNAYIIHGPERATVGKAFGSVEPSAMTQLIKIGLFEEITITDYQAILPDGFMAESSAASILEKPWHMVVQIFSWLWTSLFRLLMQEIGITVYSEPIIDDDIPDEDYTDAVQKVASNTSIKENKTLPIPIPVSPKLFPAFVEHIRYLLDQKVPQWYFRPEGLESSLLSVRRIQHTNLLLVVIDRLQLKNTTISPLPSKRVTWTDACVRYSHSKNMTKRRLPNCVCYSAREEELDACGSAVTHRISYQLVAVFVFVIVHIILLHS